MPEEGRLSQFKRFVAGKPIRSHLAHHERMTRVTGLAALSSDALSSVACVSEEVARVPSLGCRRAGADLRRADLVLRR